MKEEKKGLIFLVGFMGAGKTTLGKQLAKKLQIPFIDMDDLVEQEIGETIASFFETYGEAAFRKQEETTLIKLIESSTHSPSVVATGGGTPCFFQNIVRMNQAGISIYLRPHISHLVGRLWPQRAHRPLIKDLDKEALVGFIQSKLAEREPFYQQATYTLEGEEASISGLKKILIKA
ncbi:MAG: shikimate kinase [Bacteroidota bacterium]